MTPADRARVGALVDRGLSGWRTAACLACGPKPEHREAAEKLCRDSGVSASVEDLDALAAVGRALEVHEQERRAVEEQLAAALSRALPVLLSSVFVRAGRGVVGPDDPSEVVEENARGLAALRAWTAALEATAGADAA